MTNILTIQTPLGAMTLVEGNGALTELRLKAFANDGEQEQETPLLNQAAQELHDYFSRRRKTFSVPLAPEGTAFQQTVWSALRDIPYGHTLSYGGVAKAIGKPNASRAVGMANNRNPLPIFIPCHRVIGADGKMVGYGGGLDVKDYLLKLETP
ncbi:MAG TPA: methylated-DNA--[protein]-cysteine S-methyltransferase [Candidatus Limiplasma sp.]|nr:methylated-DNA--[protein]-cysteine S-methyltransferase [Candidatus Limiplasma sp.]